MTESVRPLPRPVPAPPSTDLCVAWITWPTTTSVPCSAGYTFIVYNLHLDDSFQQHFGLISFDLCSIHSLSAILKRVSSLCRLFFYCFKTYTWTAVSSNILAWFRLSLARLLSCQLYLKTFEVCHLAGQDKSQKNIIHPCSGNLTEFSRCLVQILTDLSTRHLILCRFD